jgi:hypothetical protein
MFGIGAGLKLGRKRPLAGGSMAPDLAIDDEEREEADTSVAEELVPAVLVLKRTVGLGSTTVALATADVERGVQAQLERGSSRRPCWSLWRVRSGPVSASVLVFIPSSLFTRVVGVFSSAPSADLPVSSRVPSTS